LEDLMLWRRHRAASRRARSGAGAGILAALALATAATACAHFTPTVPMQARSEDVDLRLERLRAGAWRELVFASNSVTPHALKRGWLTVATRDPCSGGAEVTSIAIDGGAVGDGVLPPGPHELAVRFDDDLNDYTLDVVMDLEIDNGACLRAPAISQVIPLVAERRFVAVSGMGLSANPDLAGFRGVFDFNAGGGGWLGPVLLTAQVGLGFSLCNEGTCGKDDMGSLKSGWTVPFSVDARYALGTASMNRVFSVGLIGARYAFVPVNLPAFDGDRRFMVHEFQGVLGWGLGDNLRGPFQHLERAMGYEFAVPLGVVVYPDSANQRVAFAGGMELRVFFQL